MVKSPRFVVVRILETTRQRLKIKAVKERKKIYQVVDELSYETKSV